jgi:urea transporter
MSFYQMIKGLFRGVGQVMFQNNALSGILMLVGIGCNSLPMCLFALLGTIISTLTAVVLKYSEENIENGLYGFNGTLVGIAVPCFMAINVWSVVLMVIASVAATFVARGFEKQKLIPTLTAPFVILTWVMLLVSYAFPELQQAGVAAVVGEESFSLLRAASLNFGQIMLQGNSLLTGMFFFLAILVNSRKMALDALLACALSLLVVCVPLFDIQSINNGMYGYNAILTVLAVANILNIPSWKYTKALIALVLSIAFQYVGLQLGIVTLTAPFVLSVWLIALYNAFKVYLSNDGRSRAI